MIKKTFFILIVNAMLMCNLALAQQVTVEGVGIDRNSALRDAFRNAVERVVGVMVDSSTLVRNAQVVNDEIYANSQGFVQNYQVQKETVVGGQYSLTVLVDINREPNSELLGKLQKLKIIKLLEDPRIAVIIRAKHLGSIESTACETAVNKALIEAGFRHVVDPRQVAKFHASGLLIRYLDNGDVTIVQEAKRDGYDYLVVGDAFSEGIGQVMNSMIYSSRGTVDVRIIKVDTGEIVATDSAYASGVDITNAISGQKALQNAGIKTGEFVVNKLMAHGQDSTRDVQFRISGLASYDKLNKIVDAIKNATGSQGVYVREYNNGNALIDIDSNNSGMSIFQTAKNGVGYSLELIGRTANVFEIRAY